MEPTEPPAVRALIFGGPQEDDSALAQEPTLQDLLTGSREAAAGRLTGNELESLERVASSYFSGDGPLDEGSLNEIVDNLLAASSQVAASPALEWREAAIARVISLGTAIRPRGAEVLANFLGGHRELARGLDSEPWFLTQLAVPLTIAGRLSEANAVLDDARGSLLPDGMDPANYEPLNPGNRTAFGYWLNARISFAFKIGELETEAIYAEQLARVAESEPPDAFLLFMATNSRLRSALARGDVEAVRSVWREIDGADWTKVQELQPFLPQLTLSRWWAEVDTLRRGEPSEGDPVTELQAMIDDPIAKERGKWLAGLALALHFVDCEEDDRAVELLETLRAETSQDQDQALTMLALRMRRARLAGEWNSLQVERTRAATEFDLLLDQWTGHDELRFRGGLLQLVSHSAFVLELLRAELALHPGADGVHRALGLLLRTQPALPADRQVSIDPVLEALAAPSRGTLTFVSSRLGTLALWVGPAGSEAFELPPFDFLAKPRADLDRAAVRYIERPTAAARATLSEAVGAATEMLLPPELWSAMADCEELVLVGAEDLGWPAFELLEPEAGRPLGLDRAVSYLGTLHQAVSLGAGWKPSVHQRGTAVVVGPSGEDVARRIALRPLPLERRELAWIEEISEAFEPDCARTVLGEEASLEALQDLTGIRWLSLTVHGAYDPFRMEPAGLWLSKDGGLQQVWFDDVAALPAPPLVTVFACGAGAAQLRRGGGGGRHLGAAFQTAGARAVALSATELDYASSLRLQAALGTQLGTGVTVAEALRLARVSCAEESDGYPVNALLVRLHGWGGAPLGVFDSAGGSDIGPKSPRDGSRGLPLGWAAAAAAIAAVAALALARRRAA